VHKREKVELRSYQGRRERRKLPFSKGGHLANAPKVGEEERGGFSPVQKKGGGRVPKIHFGAGKGDKVFADNSPPKVEKDLTWTSRHPAVQSRRIGTRPIYSKTRDEKTF